MGRLAPSSPTIHLWEGEASASKGTGLTTGAVQPLLRGQAAHTQFTSHPGTVALALHVGVSGQCPDLLLSLTTPRSASPPPSVPVTKPAG